MKFGLFRLSKGKDKVYALDRYRCLNVDWFEVTCFYKSPEKVFPHPYIDFFFDKTTKEFHEPVSQIPELELEYSPNLKHPNYRDGYRLWEKGTEKILIAEFRTHSNNPAKFDVNSFKLKLSNWTLYNGWRNYFRLILYIFKIDSYTITRLDLAFDGATMLRKAIHSTFETSFDFKYSYKGKNVRNSRPFQWHNFNFETREYTGFTIGTKDSGLYVNCYEKKQQILVTDKEYITQRWYELGMEVNDWKEFQRFEISLKYPYTLDYFRVIDLMDIDTRTGEVTEYHRPIHLTDLSDDYLYSVFDKIYNNLKLTIDGKPLIIGRPSKQYPKKNRIKKPVKTFEQRFYISYLITRWLNEGTDRQYEELISAIEYSLNKDLYFYPIIRRMLEARFNRVLKQDRHKVAKIQLEMYQLRLEALKNDNFPSPFDISEESTKEIIRDLNQKVSQLDINKAIESLESKIIELKKISKQNKN